MSEYWLFSLIIGLFLAMVALFARVQQGSWFTPGAFFALIWSMFVLLPLLGAPDIIVCPGALLWILLSVYMVYMGTILGSGRMLFRLVHEREARVDTNPYSLNLPWLSHITLICSILGFNTTIVLVLSTGRGLSALMSIDALMEMGRQFSLARYGIPGYREPELAIFLTIFIYTGALFGGTLFATSFSSCHRLIALLPLVPAITVASILTTRATLLFTCMHWVAAYSSTRVAIAKGAVPLFTPRRVILALVIALFVLVMFMMLQISREGRSNISTDVLLSIGYNIRISTFGYLGAFSQWFREHWGDNLTLSFGGFLFLKPCKWLGIDVNVHPHTPVEIGFITTNIFGIFRGLIEDFGLVGSLLFLLTGGIVVARVFRKVIQGRIMFLPVLAGFYSFTLCSFVGNMFRFGTIIVAWVIFILYFATINIRSKVLYSRGKRSNTVRNYQIQTAHTRS